jgi:NADPH-dependent curcumin reductase CurA
VRNLYLSVDPAMRGWVNAAANYSEPVAIGAVMRSIAVGEVIESKLDGYATGDVVCGMFGWQEFAAAGAGDIWFKHDPAMAPVSTALGVLGINGLTAYFCLLDVGQPQAGETVVVSTAAGAVGSAVGQIAKLKGCRAVGIAGGAEKVTQCRDEFGYDAAIDYKTADLDVELAAACPDGIDVYFDNTAGRISDAVYRQLAMRARVAICGTASIANWEPWPEGPRVERHLLVKRARMQGFLLFDYADRFAEARKQLADWLNAGKLTYREDVLGGLEAAPGAIQRLYAGQNRGKQLIKLADAGDGA